MKLTSTKLTLALCLIFYSVDKTQATTLIIQSPEKVLKEAPLIVQAYVQNVDFHPIPNSYAGYADIKLTIIEKLKGSCPRVITMRRFSISDQSEYLFTSYVPSFTEKDSAIIALRKHKNGYYKPLGLYNGVFYIKNDFILGTNISSSELKSLILELLQGTHNQLPPEIPRFGESEMGQQPSTLFKARGDEIMNAGRHMDGEFWTFDETWRMYPSNPNVKFFYNHAYAPSVEFDIVIARINDAFDVWNDLPHSWLQLTYFNTTTQGQNNDNQSVILWGNLSDGVLAQEYAHPLDPQGNPYGHRTKTGSDIKFNNDEDVNWTFEDDPPDGRTENDIDFADVLVHELGHTQGLKHSEKQWNIMFGSPHGDWYGISYFPLRTLNDGDKAGAVHQHQVQDYSGTIPHTIVLPEPDFSYHSYYKITGNLFVPSGKTLVIEAGAKIKFNGYYSIVDYGKILAEGTSSKPIEITSVTGTSRKSWKNIYAYSSDNKFKWCTFQYGDIALKVEGYPNPATGNVIENCTFINNDQGLRIHENDLTVKNCSIHDNRHGLVCMNNNDIWFQGNRIYNNDRDGVYSAWSNLLEFRYNVINNNGIGGTSSRYGIYSRESDIIHLGKQPNGFYGYNTIRDNYSHEVYASYGNPIIDLRKTSVHDDGGTELYNRSGNPEMKAKQCWFGSDGLESSGWVTNSSPLSSEPWWEDSTGMGGAKLLVSGTSSDPGSPLVGDRERIDECKRLIVSRTTSSEALTALFELYSILRTDYKIDSFGEKDSFYPFLNWIVQNHIDKSIGQLAFRYMIIWKKLENDHTSVIQLSKQALDVLDGENRMGVLGDLAFTYVYIGQIENAREVLSEYKKEYSFDEDMIEFIEDEVNDVEELIAKGIRKIEPESYLPKITTTQIPKAFRLTQNFPNPFNPFTTIKYNLPEDSFIELKIYDLIGREIRTFIEGHEEAGYKSVIWDGKDSYGNPVSSGMYLYQISAHSLESDKVFFETRKMVLLR